MVNKQQRRDLRDFCNSSGGEYNYTDSHLHGEVTEVAECSFGDKISTGGGVNTDMPAPNGANISLGSTENGNDFAMIDFGSERNNGDEIRFREWYDEFDDVEFDINPGYATYVQFKKNGRVQNEIHVE